jgi:hypothetical protein
MGETVSEAAQKKKKKKKTDHLCIDEQQATITGRMV